MGDREKRAI